MASIYKRKTGYQAQFRRKGYQPISKMFPSQQEAEAWLRMIQSETDQGIYEVNRQAETTTLLKALERYELEVTPTKKGASREIHRVRKWKAEPIAQRGLSLIRSCDIASYRDRRLHHQVLAVRRLLVQWVSECVVLSRRSGKVLCTAIEHNAELCALDKAHCPACARIISRYV